LPYNNLKFLATRKKKKKKVNIIILNKTLKNFNIKKIARSLSVDINAKRGNLISENSISKMDTSMFE
jgi:hypothetical protein